MKKLKKKNWINCIQDRNKWKLYVEKVKPSPKEEEEEYGRIQTIAVRR